METLLERGPEARTDAAHRTWTRSALALLRAEATRSGQTPLIPFRVGAFDGVDIYLKDESAHLTGSLKHRLARSLFVYALCNGDIGPGVPVIEASSGSTAVSEAYFAQLIGIPFIAVIPRSTSPEKIRLIERFGGACHLVDSAGSVVDEAQHLAHLRRGYFMDQFTFAASATDWRSDNIAEEIFQQMRDEPHPIPEFMVVGAGTGGTSTCLARYARHKDYPTQIMVADPDGSAYYDGWRLSDTTVTTAAPSRIEGIGRPRVEPSFFPALVDEVLHVPDGASVAAMRWMSDRLGFRVGASTGTNMWATLLVAQRMYSNSCTGSVVTLVCDDGNRYASTYYDDEWLQESHIDTSRYASALAHLDKTGHLDSI